MHGLDKNAAVVTEGLKSRRQKSCPGYTFSVQTGLFCVYPCPFILDFKGGLLADKTDPTESQSH